MQTKYIYKKYKKKIKIFNTFKKKKSIGFFFLKSLENSYFNKLIFESTRRLLSRKVKKKMTFIFFKNSNKLPTFKKPLKVRMGSGRGAFHIWLWKVKMFEKIFEISYFKKYYLIKKYLKKIKKKFPCNLYLTTNI